MRPKTMAKKVRGSHRSDLNAIYCYNSGKTTNQLWMDARLAVNAFNSSLLTSFTQQKTHEINLPITAVHV